MSTTQNFHAFYLQASNEPPEHHKRIAREVSRRSDKLGHAKLLDLLRRPDTNRLFAAAMEAGETLPRVEALFRHALRRDDERGRLGSDLRERGLYELPLLWQGVVAWVLVEDYAGVLMEVQVVDDELKLYRDGSFDDLFELHAHGRPGEYIGHDFQITDRAYDRIEQWAELLHRDLRDRGLGEIVTEARRHHVELIAPEHDTEGSVVAFELTSATPVHWSERYGWEVGETHIPGGLGLDAMRLALRIADTPAA